MLKPLLLAGLAAAAFAPSLAGAQTQCQDQRHDNKVVGTVLGAGIGALLGNAIGEHGGKTGGTIIGGVGGAVVGNQLAGAGTHCGENRYGYYDSNGQWVPRTSNAYGYYDANGQWIANPPAGYARDGYASGGYDQQAYPQQGYSQQGYSQQGYSQQGYQQPGYAEPAYAPPAPAYGQDAAYSDQGRWAGAPLDVRAREDWLEQRIQRRIADGSLDDRAGRRAMRELNDIRRMDAGYRGYDGELSGDQQVYIQTRLDSLRATLRADRTDEQPRSY